MIRLEGVSAQAPVGAEASAVAGESRPREILRSLDASFGPGESHLILGSNGSGKTTLIRILAGLAHPSAGRYLLDGAEVRADRPVETLWPRVATLLEEPDPQFLAETVEAEVAFGLEWLDLPGDEVRARVAEALATFDIAPLASRTPLTLSAGEKARVLLAAAMAARPGVLLLDQSLAHLDTGSRRALEARLVGEALANGWTIIRTHQDADPPLPGERLWTLEDGALRDAATLSPAEVLGAEPVPYPIALRASALLASRGLWAGPLARDAAALAAGLAESRWENRSELARWMGDPAADLWGVMRPTDQGAGGTPRGDRSDVVISLRGVGWSPPGGRRTIEAIDLELRRGEIAALIGASGSGKTTVLKLAAGLLDPSMGESRRVRVDAKPVAALALEYPERQLFGRTAAEDVAASLWIAGASAAVRRERAFAALARMGLDPARFGPRAPFTLSEGEKRRVALAGLLVDAPPALLLDEPTAGLDPLGRRALAQALCGLRARGHAILLASHDLDFVGRVASRVVVLGKTLGAAGRIIGGGEPAGIFGDRGLLDRAGLPEPELLRIGRLVRQAAPEGLGVEKSGAPGRGPA